MTKSQSSDGQGEVFHLLREMDNLLKTEKNWIKGKFAVDANDKWTLSSQGEGVSFCLTGARNAAASLLGTDTNNVWLATQAMLRVCPNSKGLIGFNDDPKTTFQDVKAVIHAAMEDVIV